MKKENEVEIVSFADVRRIFVESIRKKMLIPILGSGFSRGCSTPRGKVPSGDDYKRYMMDTIKSDSSLAPKDIKSLDSAPFSKVSAVYHETVSIEKQHDYLKTNFSHVSLDSTKQKFLSIPWPYVYTLNIDDAIENNSDFRFVVHSNRPVRDGVFDENQCVIKLHGDISEMIKYEDSISEIFDQSQYVLSIHKNASLLKKLTNDISFQNLLYIGCSLSDEIDFLFASENSITNTNVRFFCTIKNPTPLELIELGRYKITHCIVFDSFQEIYDLIYEAAQEAEKVSPSEIDHHRAYMFSRLTRDFEQNKSYLFYGKSLVNKDRSITLPYFFISRDVTDQIIENLQNFSVQFLLGGGCSGKTYVAMDVAFRVRDRDVFLFESKECIRDDALQILLNRGNCLVIADSKTLSIRQIEEIIRNKESIKERDVSFLIIENKSNQDLSGLIRLLELNEVIEHNAIPQIELPNRLNKREADDITKLLVTATLGVFSEKRSIADNIIRCSRKLIQKNRFDQIVPRFNNIRQIASLIALATENKIYSLRAVELDLFPAIFEQEHTAKPLIEMESSWSFEMTPSNSSPVKYVSNAEYWLVNQLCEFSKTVKNQGLIISAYRHIVSRLIEVYGKPDITYGEKYAPYKPYILFDNINHIFRSQGLVLIRKIYEDLNDCLSSDPNYMHQRAKCYIRSSHFEKEKEKALGFLEKAYRDASVSHSIFEKRYEETHNEKTLISIAHVQYTKAIALCHQAKILNYQDVAGNTQAVEILYDALLSPYNSYEFVKTDIFNYGNAVKALVTNLIAESSLVERNVYPLLSDLFSKI